MKPNILKKYQVLLQTLRDDITNTDPLSVKSNKSVPHEVLDEDAQPLSEMTQVIASNRNRTRSASLIRIDAALKKIKNSPDEFGICGDCGETILPKRLELMPFVELCAPCQQSRDEDNKPVRRRHLLDYK